MERNQQWMVRLLAALVGLLLILVAGAGAALVFTLGATRRAAANQQTAVTRLTETSSAARQALGRFERERLATQGDPGGPTGRLDRQIALMRIMVDEQMVLISEMAGLAEALAVAGNPRDRDATEDERATAGRGR